MHFIPILIAAILLTLVFIAMGYHLSKLPAGPSPVTELDGWERWLKGVADAATIRTGFNISVWSNEDGDDFFATASFWSFAEDKELVGVGKGRYPAEAIRNAIEDVRSQ